MSLVDLVVIIMPIIQMTKPPMAKPPFDKSAPTRPARRQLKGFSTMRGMVLQF